MSTFSQIIQVPIELKKAAVEIERSVIFIDFGNDSFKIASISSEGLDSSLTALSDPDLIRSLESSEIRLRPKGGAGWWEACGTRPALFLLAFLANVSARFRLRFQGLRRVFETARRCDSAGPVEQARLQRAVRQFLRANGLFSWKDDPKDCLPRSVALHGFLNRIGIPAEMRIGVRLAPFSSHAWVELDRNPLLDRREDVAEYHVILSI